MELINFIYYPLFPKHIKEFCLFLHHLSRTFKISLYAKKIQVIFADLNKFLLFLIERVNYAIHCMCMV